MPTDTASQPSFFVVYTKSGAQLQGAQRDADGLHQEFCGFKPATTRFREFSGEDRPYYQGLRAGSDGTQRAAKGLKARAGGTRARARGNDRPEIFGGISGGINRFALS